MNNGLTYTQCCNDAGLFREYIVRRFAAEIRAGHGDSHLRRAVNRLARLTHQPLATVLADLVVDADLYAQD